LAVAIALVVATLARYRVNANGVSWAVVHVVLVVLAVYDLATRRLPNVITLPGALIAIAMRVAFERSALVEVVIAGVAAFLVFALLAIIRPGGLGMGDVKLAGMLGCFLGTAVVPGLLIGTLLGGVAAVALLAARSRATLNTHIAYGPYLAFGGAVAILGFHPPPLV
jgi:leader peptidase (prepilin peptidase)/N-methyltransferase